MRQWKGNVARSRRAGSRPAVASGTRPQAQVLFGQRIRERRGRVWGGEIAVFHKLFEK
jgi:hypothetical protein